MANIFSRVMVRVAVMFDFSTLLPCPASSCFVFSYLHIIVKTQLFVKGTHCTQGAIVLKSGQRAPCAARFAKKGEYLLMKVLLINGSPHEKGCTYTALSLIAGELNASGIETEILNVGTKPVGGCIGWGGGGGRGGGGGGGGGGGRKAVERYCNKQKKPWLNLS